MSRRPVGRILAFLALGLVLLGLAAWLWIASAADRRWASMERRIAELAAEARARDGRRPPRDGLVPGDAWDDYLEALDLLGKDPQVKDLLDPADAAKVEALLDRNPRVLELLRRGARRAEARHPDLREEDLASPRIAAFEKFSVVGSTAARRLARESRPREAADLLLDLIQAGNDASRGAIHSSTRYTRELHLAAIGELIALKLPPDDARQVVREVERLEEDLPSCEERMRYSMLSRATAYRAGTLGDELSAWDARRFGFSPRLMLADGFERAEELATSTAGIDALSWPRVETLAAELRERMAGRGNPALETYFPDILVPVLLHRMTLAWLRVLRAALHEKATGERLDLEDPFGTTLRWSAPGSPLRIWSAGPDGEDDGGKDAEDLVLTIP